MTAIIIIPSRGGSLDPQAQEILGITGGLLFIVFLALVFYGAKYGK